MPRPASIQYGLKLTARTVIASLLALASAAALAIEDRADIEPNEPSASGRTIAWKLTPSTYRETAARSAYDLNLRGNRDNDTFWIAHYQRDSEFSQTRAGYEYQLAVPVGRAILSGQYASHGFWGGSVTLEAGASPVSATNRYVALLGWGRTNLKPYYNLNFDPNDSVLIGAGWRSDDDTAVTLYQIRDDRLETGQRVTHFVWRKKSGPVSRWTADVFHKTGKSDPAPESETFRATGFALTYDRAPWFARFARDPKVNFTNSDMLRLAIGVRF
jgi:hypothetical protein